MIPRVKFQEWQRVLQRNVPCSCVLSLLSDNANLAVVFSDEGSELWRCAVRAPACKMIMEGRPYMAAADPDFKILAFVFENNRVVGIDISTQTEVWSCLSANNSNVSCISLGDGPAVAYSDRTIVFPGRYATQLELSKAVVSMAWTKATLAVQYKESIDLYKRDGTVMKLISQNLTNVWLTKPGEGELEPNVWPNHGHRLTFSTEGEYLCAPVVDGVKVYKTNPSRTALQEFRSSMFRDPIQSGRFFPKTPTKLVLISMFPAKIILWDLAHDTVLWAMGLCHATMHDCCITGSTVFAVTGLGIFTIKSLRPQSKTLEPAMKKQRLTASQDSELVIVTPNPPKKSTPRPPASVETPVVVSESTKPAATTSTTAKATAMATATATSPASSSFSPTSTSVRSAVPRLRNVSLVQPEVLYQPKPWGAGEKAETRHRPARNEKMPSDPKTKPKLATNERVILKEEPSRSARSEKAMCEPTLSTNNAKVIPTRGHGKWELMAAGWVRPVSIWCKEAALVVSEVKDGVMCVCATHAAKQQEIVVVKVACGTVVVKLLIGLGIMKPTSVAVGCGMVVVMANDAIVGIDIVQRKTMWQAVPPFKKGTIVEATPTGCVVASSDKQSKWGSCKDIGYTSWLDLSHPEDMLYFSKAEHLPHYAMKAVDALGVGTVIEKLVK